VPMDDEKVDYGVLEPTVCHALPDSSFPRRQSCTPAASQRADHSAVDVSPDGCDNAARSIELCDFRRIFELLSKGGV
jgi:hypothetical protein